MILKERKLIICVKEELKQSEKEYVEGTTFQLVVTCQN